MSGCHSTTTQTDNQKINANHAKSSAKWDTSCESTFQHQYTSIHFFIASTWKRVLSSTQLLCTMNTLVCDETCTSVICLKQGHCLHYRKDDSLIIKEERVFQPLSRIWNIPGTSQYPKKTPVQTIQEFIKMDTSWGSPGVCIGAVPYSTNILNFGESQTIWIKVRHFTYGTATSGTFKALLSERRWY